MAKPTHLGKLRLCYDVLCGICEAWTVEQRNRPDMEASLLREGWKKHPEHGWICPNCAEKLSACQK